ITDGFSPKKPRTFKLSASPCKRSFPSNIICNQKYSVLTFLPLVLLNQFKYFFNLYFLLVALSQLIKVFQIGNLYTYWGPLLFVLIVTISKEAYDDFQRFRRDCEVNSSVYKKLRVESFEEIKSADLKVGDVLLLEMNQRVPADCLLLRTSDKSGSCFIRTDQLDGETDWKLRVAVPSCQMVKRDEEVFSMDATVFADKPTKDIHYFTGNFMISGRPTEPLSVENMLWANTVLASGTALCCVIYTGKETRSVMNTSPPANKIGLLDREINVLTKMLFALTLVLSFVLVALKGLNEVWYVYMFRFVLLFSYIIPISLRVNLDFAKVFYSYTIEKDKGIPGTVVRTSSIPEELGRIHYLLSDKTGTLTQNEMLFERLHMGTVSFNSETFLDVKEALTSSLKLVSKSSSSPSSESLLANSNSVTINSRIKNVVTALALCHNVTPISDNGETIGYQAASPDEIALVNWTAELGLRLVYRDLHRIVLEVDCENLSIGYEILHVFAFTSETKRMGVIAKEESSGEIVFLLKGADVIMSKIVMHSDWLQEECDNMAREGLRTLVVARKTFSLEEYTAFNSEYTLAKCSTGSRQENVRRVIQSIEHGMELLGVTGVRDKLQEDIKPTLELLKDAGIRIWMLTGDKMETATCIAISTRLVSRSQEIHQFAQVNNEKEAIKELYTFKKKENCALVIDGSTLQLFLSFFEEDFIEVASKCPTVICCRCTPTQKAEIVKLIKRYSDAQVCAIGDGGNDVSMIQSADIGIGIVGKEGKQASLAADISITKFKHIVPLFLWHGRTSYKRSAALAQFVIHRGLIISVIQAVFSAVFYFSAISLYQGPLLVGYATIYTSLPVFSLVLDVDLTRSLAIMYPELYKDLTKGRLLTMKTFFAWVGISTYQGASIMIGALLLFNFGEFIHIVSISFTALILTELLMVALTVVSFHWLMVVSVFGSFLAYILSIFVLTNYFDLKFVCSFTFLWKLLVITTISCFPLFFLKQLRHRLDPPNYSKLT
ncbi:probable phospholipid-transporting ATPase IIB, partial [Zophobas morio]